MGTKNSPRPDTLLIVLKIEKQFENEANPDHLVQPPALILHLAQGASPQAL